MVIVCICIVALTVDWKQQSLNFRKDMAQKKSILEASDTEIDTLRKDSIIYE